MNTAFYVVFTLFVVAMVGLGFTAVRWAVRRDQAARTHPPEPGPPNHGPATGP